MSWRGWQLKRPRIRAGGFYFSRGFAARSRALRARISRLRRSCARLDKTAMLRRLRLYWIPRQRNQKVVSSTSRLSFWPPTGHVTLFNQWEGTLVFIIITPVIKIFKTADGISHRFDALRHIFKTFHEAYAIFFKWTVYRKPYWKCPMKYSAHFVAYFSF